MKNKTLSSNINWSGEFVSKERGEKYFLSNLINLTYSKSDFIVAVIKGSSIYQTTLDWSYSIYEELELICSCSCPAYKKFEEPCKHVWGLMMYCDFHRDNLRSFYSMLESTSFLYNIELITHWEIDPDEYYPLSEYQDDLISAHSLFQEENKDDIENSFLNCTNHKVKTWENELSSLERYIGESKREEEHALLSKSRPSKSVLWYEIESYSGINLNSNYKYLDINLHETSILKNGSFGKLKTKNYQERMLENSKYKKDEKYLHLIAGFFNSSYYGPDNEAAIPTSLATLVLKELEHSKRLFIHTRNDVSSNEIIPLQISNDTFHFKANISKDKNDDWILGGIFIGGSIQLEAENAFLTTDLSFLVHKNTLYPTDLGKLKTHCEYLLTHGNIKVPNDKKDDLKRIIKNTIGLEQTLLDQDFDLEKKLMQGIPKIEINLSQNSDNDFLKAKCYFLYESEIHSPLNEKEIYNESGIDDLFLIKDRNFEKSILAFLESSNAVANILHHEEYFFYINIHLINDFVKEASLLDIEVRTQGYKLKHFNSTENRITSNQDWFELSGSISFDQDEPISIPDIIKKKELDKNFIILGDGTLGIKPTIWLEKMKNLSKLGVKDENQIKFNKAQSIILDFLLEDLAVSRDLEYQNLLESLKSFKKIESVTHSKLFKGTLRGYQKSALDWLNFLYQYNLGGCLADDMGLGKTIQVLAHLQRIKYLKNKKGSPKLPHLIVVPKSLLHNWQAEAKSFTPDLSVLIYEGSKRDNLLEDISKHDLIIMTYAVMRLDIQKLKDISFDYAILDEAQNIKNSSTLVTKASYLIQAKNKLALTGTPVENHLGELFSLFRFLIPNLLPAAYASGKIKSDKNSMNLILKGLMPFILRRTKDEVLNDLPDKIESILYCDFESKQEKIYNEMKTFYQKSLTSKINEQNLSKSKIQILEALLRMRQISCHPALVNSDYQSLNSSKMIMLIETLIPLVEKGEKVLIFSQFTQFLKLIANSLEKHSLEYCYLDGQSHKRENIVNEFKTNPKKSIFLISLKAGGVGLNLTEANYCFLVDPWWNPAVESQAIDRIHRIGQKKKVFAYRLITRNSIEEKILKLQSEKKALTKDLFTTDESLLRQLEAQDLAFLFQ